MESVSKVLDVRERIKSGTVALRAQSQTRVLFRTFGILDLGDDVSASKYYSQLRDKQKIN